MLTPAMTDRITDAVREYEFETWAVSCSIAPYPPGVESDGDRLDFKRALQGEVAEIVASLRPGSGRVLQEEAQVIVTLTWPEGVCGVIAAPVYVYGRYLKWSRFMPNTRWPCRKCRGTGCPRCGGSGRMYRRTIEDILADELRPRSGAEGTRLHACGREDVDARTLGTGRPFAIELRQPRRRRFDLQAVERAVNLRCPDEMSVSGLRFVEHSVLPLLYDSHPAKRYEALVLLDRPVEPMAIESLPGRGPMTVEQTTPGRVAHRRSRLTRRRRIEVTGVRPASGAERFEDLPRGRDTRVSLFRLALRTQSGAYVKEFISGDEGRTRPSLAELLGVGACCLLLDVTDVEMVEPEG